MLQWNPNQTFYLCVYCLGPIPYLLLVILLQQSRADCRLKTYWTKTYWAQNILGNILDQNIFIPKHIVPTQNILGPKHIGPKTYQAQNILDHNMYNFYHGFLHPILWIAPLNSVLPQVHAILWISETHQFLKCSQPLFINICICETLHYT